MLRLEADLGPAPYSAPRSGAPDLPPYFATESEKGPRKFLHLPSILPCAEPGSAVE